MRMDTRCTFELIVHAGRPSISPTLARALQVAPVAFGGAAVGNRRGGLSMQAAVFGGLGAVLHALGGFLVQLLGHRCRAARATDALDHHRAFHAGLPEHHRVAHAHLTRGFDVPDVMIGVSARPFSKSFSSHVQQMGRIMRPCEGKTHGIWLDHSGNYLRFRKDWDDLFTEGVTSLPEGAETAKKEPTEKEKKEAKCGGCGALWVWPDRICGECGWVRPSKEVLNVPGKMIELEMGKSTTGENQSFYSELLYYSRMRGYKDGWAAHKYKEKYGAFPRGLGTEIKSPSYKTLNWIKSKNIAYAKARA